MIINLYPFLNYSLIDSHATSKLTNNHLNQSKFQNYSSSPRKYNHHSLVQSSYFLQIRFKSNTSCQIAKPKVECHMLKVTLMGLYIWIEPEIQVMMEDSEVPKQSLHQLSLFKVSFILVVVVYTCLLKDKHLIFIRTRQR